MDKSTLCIGIDFGTTFTGVSWAWSGKPDEIHTVTRWPTKLHRNSDREKTPTEFHIELTRDGDEKITWGYNVPAGCEPFRWFKLLLVEEDQLPPHLKQSPELRRAREKMEMENYDPVGLVSKYLKEVWQHTIKHITNTLSENAVNECRFHIVLTVPAIWKDAARQNMVDAAEAAGLLLPRRAGRTTIELISEPEAGAISTFSSMEGRPDIKQGDSILVVDAGGGTVDLISYTVESLSPFTMGESVEGSGGLCGAVFVDRSFQNFLRKWLTPDVWDSIPPKELQKFINSEWEHGIKQEFDGVDEKSFTLDLPHSCSEMVDDTELTLEHGHLKEIFDHVVEEINDLVWKQIKNVKAKNGIPPKYVILVGGFGRCQYIGTSIRNLVDSTKTSVLQSTGSRPWTAICRGAVLHGLSTIGGSASLPVQISSRISRAHYGVTVDPVFVEGVHDERDKYWDKKDGLYWASNQMDWYVLRGDNVSTLLPKTRAYYMHYGVDERPLHLPITTSFTIYTSTEEPAPSRFAGSTSIKRVWNVDFTSPVPFKDLPIHSSAEGIKYRKLRYQVKVTTSGSSANFEVYSNTADGIEISAAKLIGTQRIDVNCGSDLEDRFSKLFAK